MHGGPKCQPQYYVAEECTDTCIAGNVEGITYLHYRKDIQGPL